jgi:Cu-processing system ATP-binding protein
MSNLFEAHRLSKRYGAKTVLQDVSLGVGGGHCVAVLGHNGAGKTTLMKLLLGLTAPSAGRVTLFGQDPRGRRGGEVRRAVGYLPENVAFEGAMTGHELLRFYAGVKRVDRARCETLLEEVGLADTARQRVRTYSKGMRQRLGLAQALLGEPRLLFLDEPTNGLDPPLRRYFYQAITGLTAKGTTAIVSSHILTEIEARADIVAILRAGELVAFGSLDELRRASRLPVRLRLKVTPDAVGAIAQAVGGGFALDKVEGDTMDFVCDTADKMAIVRRVAKLNGMVRDLDILPPRLEDIYAHFVADETTP